MFSLENLLDEFVRNDDAATRFLFEDELRVLGKRRREIEEAESQYRVKLQKLGPEPQQPPPFGKWRIDPQDSDLAEAENQVLYKEHFHELIFEGRLVLHQALRLAEPGQKFYVPEASSKKVVLMHVYELAAAPTTDHIYRLVRGEKVILKKLEFEDTNFSDIDDTDDMERLLLPVCLPKVDAKTLYKYMFGKNGTVHLHYIEEDVPKQVKEAEAVPHNQQP